MYNFVDCNDSYISISVCHVMSTKYHLTSPFKVVNKNMHAKIKAHNNHSNHTPKSYESGLMKEQCPRYLPPSLSHQILYHQGKFVQQNKEGFLLLNSSIYHITKQRHSYITCQIYALHVKTYQIVEGVK